MYNFEKIIIALDLYIQSGFRPKFRLEEKKAVCVTPD